MIKDALCYTSVPIAVQASLRDHELALDSSRSDGCADRYGAALVNTGPAPASVILLRNPG